VITLEITPGDGEVTVAVAGGLGAWKNRADA
jgi:hypothetical protein